MIKAEIVAHSLSPQKEELISALCTFPKIILAEVNTHRMLSKNTSSSRAIPFEKMVEVVKNNPFVPIAWQRHHPGMQGTEYLSSTNLFNLTEFISILSNTLNNIEDKNSEEYKQFKKRLDEKINIIENLLQEYAHLKLTLPNWWLFARDKAVEAASILYVFDVTKQLCNRLLEPFMWTTMLITGSKEGWDNFFNLRCPQYTTPVAGEGFYAKSWKELQSWHSNPENEDLLLRHQNDILFKLQHNKGQAEIHMMQLAECIYDAVNESTPKQLKAGEWHIPFDNNIDEYGLQNLIGSVEELKVKISTAMAAHTSYTIVGNEPVKSYEKWLEIYDKLVAYDPPHSSPMEHCNKAMSDEEYRYSVKGNIETQDCEIIKMEDGYAEDVYVPNNIQGWCRNFRGFIQLRHLIETKQV